MGSFVMGTVVCVAALLSAEKRGAKLMAALLKPVASLGFLGAALTVGALDHATGRVLFVGLLLSFLGDVCLIGRSPRAFLAGLGAFLLAHVAFAVSFGMRTIDVSGVVYAAVPLALLLAVVGRWLRPHVKASMRTPVAAYMIAIVIMVALAAGAVSGGARPTLLLGATLFLISDLAVARDRFVAHEFSNRLWGLPLYYAAQLVLASVSGPA